MDDTNIYACSRLAMTATVRSIPDAFRDELRLLDRRFDTLLSQAEAVQLRNTDPAIRPIQEAVAAHFGLTVGEIADFSMEARRDQSIITARHVAMFLIAEELGVDTAAGAFATDRDNVGKAVAKISALGTSDLKMASSLALLREQVRLAMTALQEPAGREAEAARIAQLIRDEQMIERNYERRACELLILLEPHEPHLRAGYTRALREMLVQMPEKLLPVLPAASEDDEDDTPAVDPVGALQSRLTSRLREDLMHMRPTVRSGWPVGCGADARFWITTVTSELQAAIQQAQGMLLDVLQPSRMAMPVEITEGGAVLYREVA